MKTKFTKYLPTSAALIVLLAGRSANAALPTAADVSAGTGVTTTTSPVQFIRELFSSGAGIAAVAVVALTFLGVAWSTYASFTEAREKGDWKKFGITASIGVVLVVAVTLIALLAVDYAAP